MFFRGAVPEADRLQSAGALCLFIQPRRRTAGRNLERDQPGRDCSVAVLHRCGGRGSRGPDGKCKAARRTGRHRGGGSRTRSGDPAAEKGVGLHLGRQSGFNRYRRSGGTGQQGETGDRCTQSVCAGTGIQAEAHCTGRRGCGSGGTGYPHRRRERGVLEQRIIHPRHLPESGGIATGICDRG